MKTIYIIIISAVFAVFAACDIKEPCEINNEGQICITNNLDTRATVFSDGSRVMELDPEETKCVNLKVGTYSFNVFSGTEEWKIENIGIKQCETSEIIVP